MPPRKWVYCDTSSLAMRYNREPGDALFEEFMEKHLPLCISTLTITEIRRVIAKARLEDPKNADATWERRAFANLQRDIDDGYLHVFKVEDEDFIGAVHLIDLVFPIPLRSLDAIHLGIAQRHGFETIATSDEKFGKAARHLKFNVVWFGPPRLDPNRN